MDNETKVKSLVIDVMFVPRAEVMVGPFVYRMVKIKRARVNAQFVQIVRVELSRDQNIRICTFKNLDRLPNQGSLLKTGVGATHSLAYGSIFCDVNTATGRCPK